VDQQKINEAVRMKGGWMERYAKSIFSIIMLLFCACATLPLPHSFETARINPKEIEVTPKTSMSALYGPEFSIAYYDLGVHFTAPMTSFIGANMCWGITYAPDSGRGGMYGRGVISLIPIKNVFALLFQADLHGQSSNLKKDFVCGWANGLGFCTTIPLTKSLDLNLIAKYILTISNDPNQYIAANFNIGIAQKFNKNRVIFRPEISHLYNMDGDNDCICAGLSVTFGTGEPPPRK
jgi:hypothetical protein